MSVRHMTPGLGAVPYDPENEPCSGVVGAALGIAQAQARIGYSAQLIGWSPDPPRKQWNIGGVEVHSTPGWRFARLPRFDFSVIAPLTVMSARLGPVDVLHVYADPHLLLAPGSAVKILHLQTPTRFVPRTWRWLLGKADAVVCCSDFIREQFLDAAPYPESRAFTVHNGVDLSRFDVNIRMKTRQQLGIQPEATVVLFAGAVVPEKGLLELVKALASLGRADDFVLLVAGSGALWALPGEDDAYRSYSEEVQRIARGLNVHLLGSVARDRMPEIYAASDLMVVPSVWDEPFGMVAVEAMAAGKPVIASRAGGLSEIVIEGENGLLVSPGSVDELAGGIRRLLDDDGLRARMGTKARERAEVFSWANAVMQLDRIYEGVTQEEPVSELACE